MCIICVSKPGCEQPSVKTLRTMFLLNPHGAGYMVARGGKVFIHKGFMNIEEFLNLLAPPISLVGINRLPFCEYSPIIGTLTPAFVLYPFHREPLANRP